VKKLIVLGLALLSLVGVFFAGRYAFNKGVNDIKADIRARWQINRRWLANWVTAWKQTKSNPEAV
jgi:hypothetical protein